MTARKGPRRDAVKERFWREVIAGQPESGLSVRVWCLQWEVSEAPFYAWRRELARRGDQAEGLPRFAEVVVADRGDFSGWVALSGVKISCATGILPVLWLSIFSEGRNLARGGRTELHYGKR